MPISRADRPDQIEDLYQRILEHGRAGGAGSKFIRLSEFYANGGWRGGSGKLSLFSRPLSGTFLDYGSKFGHLTPVIQSLGADRVVNVDVDDEYLVDGKRFIGSLTGAAYVKSRDCFLDVPSGSVDFVLMKEVISHIHPSLLYTAFCEVARILRPGGEVLISDGNNLDDPEIARSLRERYCEWEHGTSKELGSNYQCMRERIIAGAFPSLSTREVQHYARNTSGLHGEQLIETVRAAIEGNAFIERPHREGQLPVHPGNGTVMERGFHIADVVSMLAEHGLAGERVPFDGPAFVIRASHRNQQINE